MFDNPNNREFVRVGNWSVNAKICTNEGFGQWADVQVLNIAAGGLLFLTDLTFEKGDKIRFDLLIDPLTPGVPMKIPMKVVGEIRDDRGTKSGMRSYSIEFTEISNNDRIRLDELVRHTNYKFKIYAESDCLDM